MEQVAKKNTTAYLLVTALIALTGFEFLFRAPLVVRFVILSVIGLLFFYKGNRIKSFFFVIVIVFLIPFSLQALFIGDFYLFLSNGALFCIQLLICYFVYEMTHSRFEKVYTNLIFSLALISLILFPLQFFLPNLDGLIKNGIGSSIESLGTKDIPEVLRSKTLIFYTYMAGLNGMRNSGPFWEPGMFAVFLNIALLINLYFLKNRLFSFKSLVIVIAILTTLSTTGYLVLLLILSSKILLVRNKRMLILYLPLFIALIYFTYSYVWSLEIMRDKIEKNYDARSDRRSRFGAFAYHLTELEKSPLTGVSIISAKSEEDILYEDRMVSPNGLSLVFFVWGLPVGLVYYLLFFRGIRNWIRTADRSDSLLWWLFITSFLLLAFSQDITVRYFYTFFLFYNIKNQDVLSKKYKKDQHVAI